MHLPIPDQSQQLTRLYTTDTKALNHVLMNSYIYQKPEAARYNLGRIVGPGAHLSIPYHLVTQVMPLFRPPCR